MFLRRWLRWYGDRSKAPRGRRRCYRERPFLEALEERTVPTVTVPLTAATTSSFGVASTDFLRTFGLPAGQYRVSAMTLGPDGNLWFGADGNPYAKGVAKIGVFNLATNTAKEFTLPAAIPGVTWQSAVSMTAGPDGNVWFTLKSAYLGMVNPSTHAITQFATPGAFQPIHGLGGITAANGALWFVDLTNAYVDEFSPSTHVLHQYRTGAPLQTGLAYIAAGPGGTLWVTQTPLAGGGFVMAGNTATGAISQPITTPRFVNNGQNPFATGPDGYEWVYLGSQLARINPTTFKVDYIDLPSTFAGATFGGIAGGPGGAVWFLTSAGLGMIDPRTKAIQVFGTPAGAYLTAAGSNLWYVAGSGSLDEVVVSRLPGAAPSVSVSPRNATVTAGHQVTLTSTASGFPLPAVQWKVSTDGGRTFANILGANAPTLTFTATAGQNGYVYQAVWTNASGTVSTDTATLTVEFLPKIVANPRSQAVDAGKSVAFSASASASPPARVQWQVSTDGGKTFSDIDGANATTLSFNASPADNGNRYRALFSNDVGSAATTAALLTVYYAPTVITDPVSQTLPSGNRVTLTAASDANPVAGVQWQVSTDGFQTFTTIAGANQSSLSFVIQEGDNGKQYRALFSNRLGQAKTKSATLSIDDTLPLITPTGAGGVYDGKQHPISATVTGVNGVPVQGTLSYTYYTGAPPSGTGSFSAPIDAGTYTAAVHFISQDPRYTGAKRGVTFTIGKATPKITVIANGGPYTGRPYAATATATGVGGATVNGTFGFAYYAGSSATGTGSANPPVNPGTYAVVATFTSSDPNYKDGQGGPATFTIFTLPTGPLTFVSSFKGAATGLLTAKPSWKYVNNVSGTLKIMLTGDGGLTTPYQGSLTGTGVDTAGRVAGGGPPTLTSGIQINSTNIKSNLHDVSVSGSGKGFSYTFKGTVSATEQYLTGTLTVTVQGWTTIHGGALVVVMGLVAKLQ